MGWALRTMNKGQMLFNRCIQRDSGRHTDTHTRTCVCAHKSRISKTLIYGEWWLIAKTPGTDSKEV